MSIVRAIFSDIITMEIIISSANAIKLSVARLIITKWVALILLVFVSITLRIRKYRLRTSIPQDKDIKIIPNVSIVIKLYNSSIEKAT